MAKLPSVGSETPDLRPTVPVSKKFFAILALVLSTACGSETVVSPPVEGYRSIRTIGRTAEDPAGAMLGVGCRVATAAGDSTTIRFAPRSGRPQLFDCAGIATDSVEAATRRYLYAAIAAEGDAFLMAGVFWPIWREWCVPSAGWWQSDGTWYLPPNGTLDACVMKLTYTYVADGGSGEEEWREWPRLPLPGGSGGPGGGGSNSVTPIAQDTANAGVSDSMTTCDPNDDPPYAPTGLGDSARAALNKLKCLQILEDSQWTTVTTMRTEANAYLRSQESMTDTSAVRQCRAILNAVDTLIANRGIFLGRDTTVSEGDLRHNAQGYDGSGVMHFDPDYWSANRKNVGGRWLLFQSLLHEAVHAIIAPREGQSGAGVIGGHGPKNNPNPAYATFEYFKFIEVAGPNSCLIPVT
ncbi:MAG: hypothetical protein IPP98_09855 [Gemmatimonadetes bacterium]|nr:hypothetical protein [Gemmatimonadota bacterium]